MNYLEFAELPFNKQIHETCLTYCRVNGLATFVKSKPSQSYYKVRAYLWKIPRQNIKNIWKWLTEKQEMSLIWDLDKKATAYIEEQNRIAEKEKLKSLNVKEYDEIGIEDLLNDWLS